MRQMKSLHLQQFIFLSSLICAVIFSFLPSILCLGNVRENVSVFETLKSHTVGYALIFNLGIVSSYFADFVLDIWFKLLNVRKNSTKHAGVVPPKLFLISSFIIPNLLILVISIPNLDVDLLVSLIVLRWILIVYGFSYHIWLTGGPHFQTKWFILGNFLLIVSFSLGALDFYACFPNFLLLWIAIGISIIGNFILMIIYIRWILSLKVIGFKKLSLSQRNCFWHTVIFAFFCMLFYTITISRMGDYDVNYFILITFIESMMTLGLITSDNQLSKSLETSMKEVRNYI
jgi:hypothetical protein